MEIALFLIGVVAATLRVATPLIYGTLGELFAERSGVLNLGIEGTMFLGAFTGFAVAAQTGSLWLGLLGAICAGVISGLLMALLSVRFGVNQHVSGLGITLLMTGISLFAYRVVFGESKVQPSIDTFPMLKILPDTSIFAPIVNQYLLTYIAILMIPLVWWVIGKTRFGLKIRAVGENPEAADAAGLNVLSIRTWALAIGGGIMAIGGAFLSIAQLGSFTFGIVAGRGWVCIALIIFANWNAINVLWGSLIFGGVQALQLRLQPLGFKLPYELFLSLPYVVTIIALTVAGRNATAPSALLKAYRRE
jgi:general nucleoside transport system permease protein